MRRLLFCTALALIAITTTRHCAEAQNDVRIETYKMLLSEANERLAQANGQLLAVQAEIAQLKAEIAKMKSDKKE